jgi:hypothetical protein
VEELVRLPGAENGRRRDAMVTVVESIPRDLQTGAQIVGDYYRAGADIPRSRLWRTERHPAIPLVIEDAGAPGGKPARGWDRRKQGNLYRLWTYVEGRWGVRVEVTLMDHHDWMVLMRPALLEVYRACLAPAIAVRRPAEVAGKIVAAIEAELALVAPGDQLAVIAAVHQHLAVLSAHAQPVRAWAMEGGEGERAAN